MLAGEIFWRGGLYGRKLPINAAGWVERGGRVEKTRGEGSLLPMVGKPANGSRWEEYSREKEER
jgi:hypothetical protein